MNSREWRLRPVRAAACLWLCAFAGAWAAEPPAANAPGETPAAHAPVETPAAHAPLLPVVSQAFCQVEDSYDSAKDAGKIELDPLVDVLLALRAATPAQLRAARDPNLSYRLMMGEERLKYRGAVAEVEGRLQDVYTMDVPENRTGCRSLWRGQISTEDRIVNFVSPEALPEGLKTGDRVRLLGVYFKRVAQVNRRPGASMLTWSPLLIVPRVERGQEFRPVDPEKNIMSHPVSIALFVAVSLGIVLFFYVRTKAAVRRANPFTRIKRARSKPHDGLFPRPERKDKDAGDTKKKT